MHEAGLVQQRTELGMNAAFEIRADVSADLKDADDVVDAALKNGQTAVTGGTDSVEDHLGGIVHVQSGQVHPRREHLLGRHLAEFQRGLHQRWLAITFAVLITCQFGLSNNSIQANTICGAMQEAFGWSPVWVGAALAALGLIIVFGGIQRIAMVCGVLVPIMAIGYLVLAIIVVVMNIELIPHVFKVIVLDAFGIEQIAGGGIGVTIMYGVKRGLFSNEAGEGSAPNVAATATVTHPVKQGLIQALGVFTDTLLVCSCTAFIILISGLYNVPELNGIALTQSALQSEIGSAGPVFIAIAILLFAFSSIIGNYYYGEANIHFITPNTKVMTAYRIFSAGVMVMFGALASFELVWNIVDFFMAFLTACNLIAIVLLGRYAFRLLDDYRSQKRRGIKEPTFHRSQLPELENELECWE